MSDETRVVSLKFDNRQFQDAVRETLSTLEKLDGSLNRINSGKGLSGIGKGADLSPIVSSISAIENRFSAFGIAGMTVISRLTNAGIDMGKKIASGLNAAINQAKTGGMTRALNLEQAKFLLEGLGADVEAVMANVNEAVDGTAYGLDEAAKAAASFAASGIEAGDKMTSALKAVAGTAAMTGADFASIADIYTTVAGQGRLMTMQLRELEGRGLNAAAVLTKYFNGVKNGSIEASDDVKKSVTSLIGSADTTEEAIRDFVTKGKIDFDLFATAMDSTFGEHAKDANLMFTGALANMKTALSRLGAKFYVPGIVYMRDIFNQTREAINAFSAGIDPAVEEFKIFGKAVSESIVNILKVAEKLGAFSTLGFAFTEVFRSVVTILHDIGDAFKDVFLPTTNFTTFFVSLSQKVAVAATKLKIFISQSNIFYNVFKGLFSIIKTGWNIFSGLFNIVKNIVIAFNEATGFINGLTNGFASLTGSIEKMSRETKVFDNLSDLFSKLADGFGKGLGAIVKNFNKFVNNTVGSVGNAIDMLIEKFRSLLNVLSEFFNTGNNLAASITMSGTIGSLSMVGSVVSKMFKSLNDAGSLKSTIFEIIDKIKGFKLEDLTNAIKPLTDQLSAMQNELKAKALLEIGAGILAIAYALTMLSDLNLKELATGMAGVAGSMGVLLGGYAVMTKIMESVGLFNTSVKRKGMIQQKDFVMAATSMLLIAGAILILAKACQMMSGLNPSELAKGLSGVIVLLGSVFGLLVGMSKLKVDTSISVKTGIALMAIATSMIIMAKACSIFGQLNVSEIVKGLSAMVIYLGAIFGFAVGISKLTTSDAFDKVAITVLAMAGAMWILGQAMKTISSLNTESIVKGLFTITLFMGETLGVAIALNKTLDEKMIAQLGKVGLAMIGMAAAMWILSKALKSISEISSEGLVNGITTITASLVAFAFAAEAMTESTAGAGAVLMMAGAMLILAAALKVLGSMDTASIAKGLITMAIAFGIMAGVAALLSVFSEALLIVGGALLMIGGSVALVGAGILMLATGLSMLAAVGSAAISTLITMLSQLIIWLGSAITDIAKILVQGLVAIFQEIVAQGPIIIQSVTQLIGMLIEAVNNNIGKIVDCGLHIITSLLDGIMQNISTITSTGVKIVTGFLDGVSSNMDGIVQSGFNLMLSFINGLANGIRNNAGAVREAIWNLCTAILEAFCSFFGIASPSKVMESQGVNLILGLINGITDNIGDVATALLNGIKGIPGKIKKKAKDFKNAGVHLCSKVKEGLGSKVSDLKTKMGEIMDKVKKKAKDKGADFKSAGKALCDGIKKGITTKGLLSKIGETASSLLKAFKKKLGISSPSKEFAKAARWIPIGIANGLAKSEVVAIDSMNNISSRLLSSFEDFNSDVEPTITPILDLSQIQNGANSIDSIFSRNQAMDINARVNATNSSMTEMIVDGIKQAFADQNSVITDAIIEGVASLSTPLQQGMVEAVDGMGIAVDNRQFGRVVRRAAGI